MTTNHFKSHVQAIAKLGLPIVVAQLGVIVQSFADLLSGLPAGLRKTNQSYFHFYSSAGRKPVEKSGA